LSSALVSRPNRIIILLRGSLAWGGKDLEQCVRPEDCQALLFGLRTPAEIPPLQQAGGSSQTLPARIAGRQVAIGIQQLRDQRGEARLKTVIGCRLKRLERPSLAALKQL
jgi:hypothetical protein